MYNLILKINKNNLNPKNALFFEKLFKIPKIVKFENTKSLENKKQE